MALSFNRMNEYFIDSLMGRAEATKKAYDNDMQQFKLYLVMYRTNLICAGRAEDVQKLANELIKSDGHLTDTRYAQRQYKTEIRTQALLDEFDLDLSKLRKEDVIGYFNYLESTKGLSKSTVSRRLSSLRRFITLLSKEKYEIHSEVLERLSDINLGRERKLPIALDLEEATNFLSLITNLRDRAIILIMLYMGLRISEVVALNVDDISAQSDGVTIHGKGNKDRYIPIHPIVLDAVIAYKNERLDANRDELGIPLFVSLRRRRIDPSTIRKMIKSHANSVERMDNRKRRHLSPHKLRHTFATLLLQGDVDIRYIQELLGHENLSTTQIYTSVNHDDLFVAIDRHPLGGSQNKKN